MRTRTPFAPACLALVCLSAGCAGAPAPAPAVAAPPPAEVKVERVAETKAPQVDKTRGELSILIGPEAEPVAVRDVRNVVLAQGVSRITLAGIPEDVEAGRMGIRATDGKAQVELVEMRPFSGKVTPKQLLEPYLGKAVTAYVQNPETGAEVAKDATLVGLSDDGPIVAFEGRVRLLTSGRVAVPALPAALRSEPQVELTVRTQPATSNMELTYSTKLIKAGLEYQLVRPSGTQTAELVGLVGIENDTGTQLLAAQVSMTSDSSEISKFAATQAANPTAPSQAVPTTFLKLPQPVTLAAGERSLTRLFGPRDVALTRKVVFEGRGFPFDGTPEEYGNVSVHAVLDARVTSQDPLSVMGMMPGRAHLFERAPGAPPHAYGTAVARPLPGALGLRVDLGDENKYPSKRKLLQKRTLGRCIIETSWDVSFTNPTEEPLPVEDVEPAAGKYELLDSSVPPIAKELDHFAFALTITPNGETHLKFKVRTSSCVVHRSGYWQPGYGKASWSKPYPYSKGGS